MRHKIKNNKLLKRFSKSEDGTSGIEFAMIVPIFLIIFFAVAELIYYNMSARRAQQSVDFAAEFLSRDSNYSASVSEIHVVEDLWQIVNPTAFANSGGDAYTDSRGFYSRAFSSIDFKPTDPTCEGLKCDFEPDVQWSFLASQGISSPKRRHCQQNIVSNSKKINEKELPEGAVGRSAIIAADFVYKHTPLFGEITPFFDIGLVSDEERHITAIRHTRGGVAVQTTGSSSHYVQC
jgi:hypothetical protein